jgi:hypothetical protein
VKSLKQVYFFIILLLGSRAGGHFTALSFSEEIVVMNLLSYFLIKTVMCGQAWLSFFVCRKELMIYEADIKTATLR